VGRIPTLSRSFSSEKSYSPSRLMCCQGITEPWATASRNPCRRAAWKASSQGRAGTGTARTSAKGSTESLGILALILFVIRAVIDHQPFADELLHADGSHSYQAMLKWKSDAERVATKLLERDARH
jgi:hypothetical protein